MLALWPLISAHASCFVLPTRAVAYKDSQARASVIGVERLGVVGADFLIESLQELNYAKSKAAAVDVIR